MSYQLYANTDLVMFTKMLVTNLKCTSYILWLCDYFPLGQIHFLDWLCYYFHWTGSPVHFVPNYKPYWEFSNQVKLNLEEYAILWSSNYHCPVGSCMLSILCMRILELVTTSKFRSSFPCLLSDISLWNSLMTS